MALLFQSLISHFLHGLHQLTSYLSSSKRFSIIISVVIDPSVGFKKHHEYFSSSLAIAIPMRLTLILLLCVPALSQDENLGNVLWNGAGTLLNIGADLVETGAVAAGAIGVTLWDLGGKGFNSLADNTKNFFTEPTIDESTSDNNVKPVAGGSGSGTTIQPTTEGQNTAEPTVGEGNTVEQTDDLITTKPSLIPLDDSTKPDKPDIKLFVTADQDKCDSTNSNASHPASLHRTRKVL